MNERQARFAGLAMFSLLPLCGGCDPIPDLPCDNMGFSKLGDQEITKIEVHSNAPAPSEQVPLGMISDPSAIEPIKQYLIQRETNWRAPAFGVPVGTVRVVFWSGQERARAFNIGPRFIEAQGCGYFFIRSISGEEQVELLQLLSLPPTVIERGAS